MTFIFILFILLLLIIFSDSAPKNMQLISKSELEGDFYRLKGENFQLSVNKYHPSNQLIQAQMGYVLADGSSKHAFSSVHRRKTHLYKIAYCAMIHNRYLGKEETLFSDSSSHLRWDIERTFRLWADLSEAKGDRFPHSLEQKIELAQMDIQRGIPRLKELYTEGSEDKYAALYKLIQKRMNYLEAHGITIDENRMSDFITLDAPPEEGIATVEVNKKQHFISTEVKMDKDAETLVSETTFHLEVGNKLELKEVDSPTEGKFHIQVVDLQGHVLGWLDEHVSLDVHNRFSHVKECRVTQQIHSRHSILPIRIEFQP